MVYDPYNRTDKHNEDVLKACRLFGVDTVTIFNVLNVIKEHEIQIEVLKLAFSAVKDSGMVFVRSMYKNPAKRSGVTKSGTFQHYKTQNEYLEIVREVFPNAELKYGIIIHQNGKKRTGICQRKTLAQHVRDPIRGFYSTGF